MDYYYELIMNILEEKGLNKKFRENPEAVSQILDLIEKGIEQENGKDFRKHSGSEIEETVRKILERQDYTREGEIRPDNVYLINEDGNFSVKYKTDVERDDYSRTSSKTDIEQIFSIEEKTGNLIVSESNDYIWQNSSNTFADTTITFRVFNSNGLEIQRRKVSQALDVKSSTGINSCKDAAKRGDAILRPIKETVLERGSDLVTEHYCVREGSLRAFDLATMKGKIINENKSKFEYSPLPLIDGNISEQKSGSLLNFPPEYEPGHLIGYSDSRAESYKELTDGEKDRAVQDIYETTATRSSAFRETLFDSAKDNSALQEVVKRLNLVRTKTEDERRLMSNIGVVKVDDLKKVYEGVSDRELRATMQSIIETSTRENGKEEMGDR